MSPGTTSRARMKDSSPSREHARGWSRHLPERLDRPLRPILLDKAEEGREHDDDTDDDRFDPVS